jgi:hypothetical protein
VNDINILTLLGTSRVLLTPIQEILERVIPDFLEQELRDEVVREAIVSAADQALLAELPAAVAIPEARRRRIIRRVLDLMLDEILLPVEA